MFVFHLRRIDHGERAILFADGTERSAHIVVAVTDPFVGAGLHREPRFQRRGDPVFGDAVADLTRYELIKDR